MMVLRSPNPSTVAGDALDGLPGIVKLCSDNDPHCGLQNHMMIFLAIVRLAI
jgi:hypothetical protein